MAQENKDNNIFVQKKLIEPNAKIPPEMYEHTALYVALYQTIFGSYVDYGFTDRAALDVQINAKIKTMMQVIDKIFKDPRNAQVSYNEYQKVLSSGETPPFKEPNGLTAKEKEAYNQIVANNWIALYLPLIEGKEVTRTRTDGTTEKVKLVDTDRYNIDKKGKVDESGKNNYASNFLKNFDRAVTTAQDLTKRIDKDKPDNGFMMSVADARMLLRAKQLNASELYEGYRTATQGHPYKTKKEEKGNSVYNSGDFYQSFMGQEGTGSATDQLATKNKGIRISFRGLLYRVVGFAAAAGITIASAGVALPFLGISTAGLFGTAFAGAGIGTAVVGIAGTVAGGVLASTMGNSVIKQWGNFYTRIKDRRDFLHGLGKYQSKDGKALGYRALKKRYYTALGLKEYFEKGKVLDKTAKKYVNDKFFKKYPGLLSQAKYFQQVNEKTEKPGSYQKLMDKLKNVVQSVPEQAKGRRRYNSEATGDVRKFLYEGKDEEGKILSVPEQNNLDNVIYTYKMMQEYKDGIGVDNVRIFTDKFTEKTIDAFRYSIFENAYSEGMLSLMKEKKENASIKEILANGKNGEQKNVDSILKFFSNEAGHADMPISTKLGVSLKHQYGFDAANMVEACESLGVTSGSPDMSAIQTIANNISSMTSSSQMSAIKADIQNNVSDSKAKTYLLAMLDKKEKGSKLGASQISVTGTLSPAAQTQFENARNEIVAYSPERFNSIRESIMSSSDLSISQKQELVDQLKVQAKRVERSDRDKKREAAYKVFATTNIIDFEEIMKKISDINYENVASADTLNLYAKTINREVNNEAERDYLKFTYEMRIEKAFNNELETNSDKYTGTGNDVLKNITSLLQKVSNHPYLNQAQKARLTDTLTSKIEVVLTKALKNIEINFLEQNAKDNSMAEVLRNYVEGDYKDGGLREFFEIKTPASIKLENRINELMAGMTTVPSLLQTRVLSGPQLEDYGNMDSKLFTTIYFSDSAKKTEILQELRNLKGISQRAQITQFTANGPETGANTFITEMKDKISNILSNTSLSAADKLSILLVAKKWAIAGFKFNMMNFIQEKSAIGINESFDNYLANSHDVGGVRMLGSTEFTTNVVNKWKTELTNQIDAGIDSLLSDPEVKAAAKKCVYTKSTLDEILGKTSQPGAGVYMQNSQMNK